MDETVKMLPVNIAIMLPSIVLALYVVPHILGVVYIVPFILLSFLPLVKRLLPQQFAANLYPIVAIFVLLVILLNLLMTLKLVQKDFLTSLLVIPLTTETAITLTMALSVAAILEGVFSRTLARSIGYQTFSLLPLLDQVFVLYLMHTSSYTYLQAYYAAYSQQVFSLMALLVTGSTNIFGTKYPPPLSEYNFTIDPVMLVAMIISLAAIMLYFIVIRESKLRSEVFSGVATALLAGGIIGFGVFYAIQLATPSGFELFVASLAIIITVLYAARSSPERKARKKGAPKQKPDW